MWLEFIGFQDEALAGEFSGSSSNGRSGSEKKSGVSVRQNAVVEKKLSIVKNAMSANPRSVRLAMERLRLSKQISDVNRCDNCTQ